jgi:GTP-binding protein EngB required for normal cell division
MASASKIDHAVLFQQVKVCLLEQGAGRIQGDQAAMLEQTIDHKLANLQPSIMLYGIYNAGKSTLINALMGAEHAAVSDRPETAMIHRYDWHGYQIFDTPGVDAPAEHQQITEAHLIGVEVVIFVMSTNGAFDESSIYKRLAQVMQNQKHLIIVLNDKTGTDEQNKHAILNKVNENLLKALKKNTDLMAQIPVVFLNAKTALKGRLESKKLLVQKSNITQLEAVIKQKMAKTSSFDSIKVLAQACLPTLNQIATVIDQQFEKSSEKALLEQLKNAELVRINLEMEVERSIAKFMPEMQDAIRDLLYEGSDEPEQLQFDVVRLVDQYSQRVLRHYQQSITRYSDSIGAYTQSNDIQIFGLADHVTIANRHQQETTQSDAAGAVISSLLVGAVDSKAPGLGGLLAGALGEFSKNRTTEWGGFWNFLVGSNESVVRSHLLSANQQAGEIRHQTEVGLHEQLTAYAATIINHIELPLRNQQHALDDKSQQLLQEMEIVHAIQAQLNDLSYTL